MNIIMRLKLGLQTGKLTNLGTLEVQDPNSTFLLRAVTTGRMNGIVKAGKCLNFLIFLSVSHILSYIKGRIWSILTDKFLSRACLPTCLRLKSISKDIRNSKRNTRSKPSWQRPSWTGVCSCRTMKIVINFKLWG